MRIGYSGQEGPIYMPLLVRAYAHMRINDDMYFAMTFQTGIQAFTLWIILDPYNQETGNSILVYARMFWIIQMFIT